jgi:hypothetical protein
MEMGEEEQGGLMDITESNAEVTSRDSTDSVDIGRQRLSTASGPSPDLSEVSSVSPNDSKVSTTAEIIGSDTSKEAELATEGSDNGRVSLKRRHSYKAATDDEVMESPTTPAIKIASLVPTYGQEQTKLQTEIKRSTSSVENASQAAIKLRRNLRSRPPRAASSTSSVYSGSLYQSAMDRLSSSAKADSAYFSLRSAAFSPVGLDQMIDREVNNRPYQAPLIGCIPPSALKCFAEEKKPKPNSPANSNSGN